MKKTLLTAGVVASLCFGSAFAQKVAFKNQKPPVNANTETVTPPEHRTCGTIAPSEQWDADFNKAVEEYVQARLSGKMVSMPTYTIPIIIHIIHQGTAVGSGDNITQAQANSQITVLNADYGGTGLNVGNVPGIWSSLVSNTGITWCAALKNPSGVTLTEPGIDRVAYTSISGLAAPGSGWSQTTIDNTIKPATIWDPTKYCNVWCLKLGAGLLGYATFPAASGNTGLSAPYGNATNDGVVILNTAFGNTGTAAAPYGKGRSATHELGHWLGLRHIWGDSNCGTDYCADTPPAQTSNYSCPTFPHNNGVCAGNTTGEMTMNFMDYTDDLCMYMFTPNQATRMTTTLANGTYRSGLTSQSVTLCNSTPQPPVAAFNIPSSICPNVAKQFNDGSSGTPTSWTWAVAPSAGVTITTPTTQNPNITFPSAGTYSVTLTATNGQGSNPITHTVTVGSCSVTGCDTLTNFTTADTLFVIRSATGYVAGNNNYGDLKKGEWYSSSPIPGTKITGGIVLFYRDNAANKGTKGTATININTYNGTNAISGGGPTGTAIATHSVTLTTVTGLTPVQGVTYCGNPTLGYPTAVIYPYSFTYATQPNVTQDFIMTVSLPANGTDTVALFMTSGSQASASTAWELQGPSPGTWEPFNDGLGNGGVTWALNSSLAILPKICPLSTEITENSLYNNMAMFPNPNNGLFNFVFTMPQSTDLNFTVSNVLGQNVMNKSVKGVTNQIVQFNLTDFGKGVYFINILSSDGKHAIQKVVVE